MSKAALRQSSQQVARLIAALVIVFIGDSITHGYSQDIGANGFAAFNYPDQLMRLLRGIARKVNLGINGHELRLFDPHDAYFDSNGKSRGTTHVFCNYGINDLVLRDWPLTQMQSLYIDRWRKLKNGGAKVIQLSILPLNTSLHQTVGPNVTFTTTTATRAAGSWISDGFRIGDAVQISGYSGAPLSGNNGLFVITSITAAVMTCAKIVGAGNPFAAGTSSAGTFSGGSEITRFALNLWFPSQVGTKIDCACGIPAPMIVSDAATTQLYYDPSGHPSGRIDVPGPNDGYGEIAVQVHNDVVNAGLFAA